MPDPSRKIRAALLTAGMAIGVALGTPGAAHADTVQGKSCGGKHPMAPEYYDVFGNAAPCMANFHVDRTVVARITVDVVAMPGNHRQDPHMWSIDLDCRGTVLPADPPRSFTCVVGPGDHTAYADKCGLDSIVHLTVDY